MSRTTPAAFEEECRASIQAKENLIQSISQDASALEEKITKFASSPSKEGLAEALQNEIELAARKSLAERIVRNWRPVDQLQTLLNTQAGHDVLKAFLEKKRGMVAKLKSQIEPLRRAAMTAETAGRDEEAFSQNEKADGIASEIAGFEVSLAHATAALARPIDYQLTVGFLHEIAA